MEYQGVKCILDGVKRMDQGVKCTFGRSKMYFWIIIHSPPP